MVFLSGKALKGDCRIDLRAQASMLMSVAEFSDARVFGRWSDI